MAEKSAGTVAEVFAAFLKLGLTSFGGPIAHLGYFRAEFVERRSGSAKQLRRPRRALPVLARPRFQPGRLRARPAARPARSAGWPRGSAFTLPSALCSSPSRSVRPLHRPVGRRPAAWPEAGRGRRRGAGGVGHGAQPGAGPGARDHRGRRCCDRGFRRRLVRQIGAIALGAVPGLAVPRPAPRRGPSGFPVSRGAGAVALVLFAVLLLVTAARAGTTGSQGLCAVRRLLSRRRAGVRRRPCRAAAAAGGGGDAGLGQQRRLPRRLRRGAGGAGTAVHLCGLSRRGDAAGAERLAGRLCARCDLPAGASCWSSARCRSGTRCAGAAAQAAMRGANAAVVGMLGARSTIRSGPAPS